MIYVLIAIFFIVVIFVIFVTHSFAKKNTVEATTKLSEVSTSLQNIAIVASILGSALWVIHTFDILQQKDKAQAELKEIQERIQNTESSNISLSTTVVNYLGYDKKPNTKGLIVDVKIKNQGKTKLTLDLSNSPLKIYQVEASGSQMGYTKLLEPVNYSKLAKLGSSDQSTKLDRLISLTSSEKTLSYFVTVESDKMYYIVFSSKALNIDNLKEECSDTVCNWFVSKYLFIGS